MSKISPDGFVKTDLFKDFSIFNQNNVIIGEYAAKLNKGSNNVITGTNAGKIGIQLNNSILFGANAGNELLSSDKTIIIGKTYSNLRDLKEIINIGFNEIQENSNKIIITNDKSPQLFFNNNGNLDIGFNNQTNSSLIIGSSNNSIISNSIIIGNSIQNDKFSLNIDNVFCKYDCNNNSAIFLGCGKYKDFPIIIGSSSLNTNDNFNINNGFITSSFTIKNSSNISISFNINNNSNLNIIYNLPPYPNFQYSYLSTDINGNLEWLEFNSNLITIINSSANIICKNLDTININGIGSLITNININNNSTDDIKQGLINIYSDINLITRVFYDYLNLISTDIISIGNSNLYFNIDTYSNNFQSNLKNGLITTDNIRSNLNRFYNNNDYYSNTSNYILKLTTNDIKEGYSNLYLKSNLIIINSDYIKEGLSNLYFKSNIDISLITTDIIKKGTSNLYYNSNININLSNLNTDFLKQGTSNIYATSFNINKFFNSNIPITDDIKQGSNNYYFSNINNFKFTTDNIKEGSNLYYKDQNQIIGIVAYDTTTNNYNEGISNLYYYEDRGIKDFSNTIISNITTDNINEGISKKFIKNNFYNNNLEINGFLQAANINDLDKDFLRLNLEPKIGSNTEVFNVYDFQRLSFVSPLSNIEISYSSIDPNFNSNVPFIIINNNVGINNSNPQYRLDVKGNINITSNDDYYKNGISITDYNNLSNKPWIISNNSNIYYNYNCNVGIGTANPSLKLHIIGDIGVSGEIRSGYSDIRLKNNIEIINNPFRIINNIQGFYYTPNDLAISLGFKENKKEIGLNALDVQKVLPEVVSIAPFDLDNNEKSKSGNNYLTVDYAKIVPVLIEGIKELKKEIEYLKKEIKYRN